MSHNPPSTLLLRAGAPLIPGLVRVSVHPSPEAVEAWRGRPHLPGAPPKRSPAAEAADRVASLLAASPAAGAAVPLPCGATTVVVYCLKVLEGVPRWRRGAVPSLPCSPSSQLARPRSSLSLHSQPHVVAVFKALATGAPAAGLAIGDVKTSVSLVPPPLPEAGRALLGAVAAGLAAAGWWVSGGPPGEDAGVGLTLLDTAPAACAGPLLSCTVLRLASAAPRPPADLALTLTASAGRARRLAAASLGEGAIATTPAAARTELAGTRCCALPDFAPVIVVDAWARYEGDEALVAAWDAVLGGGGAAGPPSLWVWVIPDDGREDEGPPTPGALCAPPAALWEAPGLICLPPGSRAGGGGAWGHPAGVSRGWH